MSDTEVMKELMLQLNNENVAALYYLRVPYDDWFFLTLYGEEKLYLELQEISYNDEGYQRIKTLHDLLVKQCEITRDCWKIVDDGLGARARAVGDKIIGRNSQSLRTQSSPIGDDCKTTLFNLRVALGQLVIKEKNSSSERVDDTELEEQFAKLEEREGELGNSFYERLRSHKVLSEAKCMVGRESLETAKNPAIYLNGLNVGDSREYCKRFAANIYGYAQFLRFLAPFSGFLSECRDDLLRQEARSTAVAKPSEQGTKHKGSCYPH